MGWAVSKGLCELRQLLLVGQSLFTQAGSTWSRNVPEASAASVGLLSSSCEAQVGACSGL